MMILWCRCLSCPCCPSNTMRIARCSFAPAAPTLCCGRCECCRHHRLRRPWSVCVRSHSSRGVSAMLCGDLRHSGALCWHWHCCCCGCCYLGGQWQPLLVSARSSRVAAPSQVHVEKKTKQSAVPAAVSQLPLRQPPCLVAGVFLPSPVLPHHAPCGLVPLAWHRCRRSSGLSQEDPGHGLEWVGEARQYEYVRHAVHRHHRQRCCLQTQLLLLQLLLWLLLLWLLLLEARLARAAEAELEQLWVLVQLELRVKAQVQLGHECLQETMHVPLPSFSAP